MEALNYSLAHLFKQLGLANTDKEITEFINKHARLPSNIKLHQASYWTASQAAFLQEAKEDDANWAEIVDQLDAMLR